MPWHPKDSQHCISNKTYREEHPRRDLSTRGILFQLNFWLTEGFDVLHTTPQKEGIPQLKCRNVISIEQGCLSDRTDCDYDTCMMECNSFSFMGMGSWFLWWPSDYKSIFC